MIEAGKLRHRIAWYAPANPEANQNTRGAPPLTGTLQYTVWASVESLTARELFVAQQTQADVQYKVRMRYRTGIRPDWWFTWDGRRFELTEPPRDPDGKKAELEVLCREYVPG